MPVGQTISWNRLTIEVVAIVASILLAFSIDAWWDDRQSRSVEQQILTNLLAEFERIQVDHNEDRRGTSAVREVVLELLRLSTKAGTDLSSDQLDSLIADSLWSASVSNYSAPVLNSTIASGEFDLISDPELRQSLGLWAERFRDISDYINRDTTVMFGRMIPFIQENGSMLQILNATECRPGVPDVCWSYGDKIVIENPISHAALIKDPRFQGLLAERLMMLTDLIGLSFSNLDEVLARAIEQIRTQIDQNN